MTDKLSNVEAALNAAETEAGLKIAAKIIDQDAQMLQIEVEGREEFPIILDIDDDQILVMTNLWNEDEVNSESRAQMLEVMLTMNMPMPLSAFGKTGATYQLFGAMAVESKMENIILEVITLSENTMEVFDGLEQFLRKA